MFLNVFLSYDCYKVEDVIFIGVLYIFMMWEEGSGDYEIESNM